MAEKESASEAAMRKAEEKRQAKVNGLLALSAVLEAGRLGMIEAADRPKYNVYSSSFPMQVADKVGLLIAELRTIAELRIEQLRGGDKWEGEMAAMKKAKAQAASIITEMENYLQHLNK